MNTKGHAKSVIKALTWRCIGAFDSLVLATAITFLTTGIFSIKAAASFVGVEFFTKSVLYYFHERVWHLPKLTSFFGG
jgi:uncharacterized membrane protein